MSKSILALFTVALAIGGLVFFMFQGPDVSAKETALKIQLEVARQGYVTKFLEADELRKEAESLASKIQELETQIIENRINFNHEATIYDSLSGDSLASAVTADLNLLDSSGQGN